MLKCGFNTSRMCSPDDKNVQRKPLQQDATRIKVTQKRVPGKSSNVYMFLAKMISIFCRKWCVLLLWLRRVMERWLPVIALYVQWSGSTLTVWGYPCAQESEWFWLLLMTIFAREYYRDNSYEWFLIYWLRTVLSCTVLAFQVPNPRSQAPHGGSIWRLW